MKSEGKGYPEIGVRSAPLVLYLEATPCDEVVEYDLINNRCRNLHHTEGKFFVPVLDGALDAMQRFAPDNMVYPEDRPRVQAFMNLETVMARLDDSPLPGMIKLEARYKTLDGDYRWTRMLLVGGPDSGLPEGVLRQYIFDIQAEKDQEGVLRPRGQAHRDERTGLLTDRDLFAMTRDRLGRMQGQWCVIAIDIEHFKLFTEWHGKSAADMLLAQISKLLRQVETDCRGLAGYRGLDDFWLVVPYDLRMIENLYNQIRDLIISHGNSVGFLPIFGICLLSSAEDEITDVFNHAAMTAEQVKGDLHHRIRVYNPSLYLQTAEEYRLLSDFQRALENKEIFFTLQPQCRVSTGNVVGAESLARWRLKDGTMVPPTKFVPILEKYRMVTNLDKYIWESVCAWLRKWMDAGHTPVPISVNVSQIDILTVDVPAFMESLLRKYELPARLLKVEITESAYVEDTASVRDTVRRIRAMGMMVLMDDFGSGYSSLNMLRSLNVDVIKLDAQFLHIDAQEERKGISILESIVNMAKSMALPIIVEGVETQEQINFLSDLGCRYMQGYYFYRAMPVEEFERLISDERRLDLKGFEFKATGQIHPRELLDENVFSDAMLNNILGPVAIYRWKDDRVDIVRFNQQYYLMVGLPLEQLESRRSDIQKFMYGDDKDKFRNMLTAATRDRLNGSKGILRLYRPNGSLRWLSVQLYYLNEDEEGKTFYASCEDVTELQFVNVDLPGGYHRCSADENLEFRYVSKNFLEMTGYTQQELETDFENKYINMIHPDDRPLIKQKIDALLAKKKPPSDPFRVKHKRGHYIYVANQQILTDLYGDLCFMSVATDVTEIVQMRNNMHVLEKYSTDCIAFVRSTKKGWSYDIVVYGLKDQLHFTQAQFKELLNTGKLYSMLPEEQRKPLHDTAMNARKNDQSFEFSFDLRLPDGHTQHMRMKADKVSSTSTSKVNYICVFQAV